MTSLNETLSALLAICAGNSPVISEFPAQRPVTRSFVALFFIRVWMNGWVNNGEAGDLRRHRAHYDDILMGKETTTILGCITPSMHFRQ